MNSLITYKISSICGGGGNCVEAGLLSSGEVSVRDTKDRTKEAHVFTADEWDSFIAGVKAGQFDRNNLPQPQLAIA